MRTLGVVLDTNVVVAAAFKPRSKSARVVDQVRRGEVRMIWNDETRRETEYIVRKIPPLSSYPVADLFRPEDRYTGPTEPEAFAFVADPEDRKFAALAAAAGATLITMDEHLLNVRPLASVPILTPREFLNEVAEEGAC